MRLHDIICEDFWQHVEHLDQKLNPEAHSYKAKQEDQYPDTEATPVVTEIPDVQPKFTNRKQQDRAPSNGWIGKVRAKYKAGHISKEKYKKLLNLD